MPALTACPIKPWTDAKVFRSPYTCELRYTRLPRDYAARPGARRNFDA